MKCLKGLLVASVAATQFVEAVKEGLNFHQMLSWVPPVDSNDMQHWLTQLSSVPHQNKVVLVPNGKEQMGYLGSRYIFEAKAWEMSIDYEVDFTSEAAEDKQAYFSTYFLKTVPDSIAQFDFPTFSKSLARDQLRGWEIWVQQLPPDRRASSGGGAPPHNPHYNFMKIQLTEYDDNGLVVKDSVGASCTMRFKRALFRFDSDIERGSTILEVKSSESDTYIKCFEYKKAISDPVHTYISSGSTNPERRAVFVHSVKFWDNEILIEDIDETLEPIAEKIQGSDSDLLHLGNIEGLLLTDAEKSRQVYNDKLITYNSLYAQLVGKQKRNVEDIAGFAQSLPNLELIDEIRKDTYQLNEKQLSFVDDFGKFENILEDVSRTYLTMQSTKDSKEDPTFAAEQKRFVTLMDSNQEAYSKVAKRLKNENRMNELIDKSHLMVDKYEVIKEKSKEDSKKIKMLKNKHLMMIDDMIFNKSKVSKKQIRGTDLPTEYVLLLVIVFIATIGILVGYQVKRNTQALPFATKEKRRND